MPHALAGIKVARLTPYKKGAIALIPRPCASAGLRIVTAQSALHACAAAAAKMDTAPAPWQVPPSDMAKRIKNPIREIVDGTKLEPNPALSVIPLSIGSQRWWLGT